MNKIKQYSFTQEKPPAIKTNIFSDISFGPVIKLGIQAAPGTTFSINNIDGPFIEVGAYGVYELDFSNGVGKIMSLYFKTLEWDENFNDGKVLVDIVYEEANGQ